MSSAGSKKRKLIFLWTYTDWGGAQMYMLNIIKQARERWDVVVAIPRASKADLLELYGRHNIPIEFLEHDFDAKVEKTIGGRLRRQYQRIRSEIGIYRYLRKFDLKESVLHIEVGPWQSWLLLCMLSWRGAKVFTTLNLFRPQQPLWRRLIWKARFQVLCRIPGFHIAASNRDVKESLREWLTPEFWESVPVAYSPLDVHQISNAISSEVDVKGLRKKFGLTEDDFVVLAVARFSDLKGRWVFLEAAKLVLAERPNARFVWLMPDPISEDDLRRIEEYGLKDRFVPILSRTVGTDRISVLQFFRIGDVFALPSFFEGLPLALIEAMALGIPSIATNIFAVPEAITPDETGLLIETGDSAALAAAILRLEADPALRRRISSAGRRLAIENFDGRIMASTYLEQYEKCFAT